MQRIWLNDTSTVHTLFNASDCAGGIRAIEMSHRNRTVCVLGSDLAGRSTPIVCHSVDDAKLSKWSLPLPDLMLDMRQIAQIRLDWTSGNWYLLSTFVDVIIVCNAAMRHCTVVVNTQDRHVQSLALDPTKG